MLIPTFFPPADSADETGLVAVTEGIDATLLIDAYRNGIFPWSENPVRWYSPDPRAIFLPGRVRIPRRLRRYMRNGGFEVTCDRVFEQVVRGCARAHAHEGVWISAGFVRAYAELHEMGHAHSVEVWKDGELAGGLYGVQIGGLFSGESMFHRVSNASKVAFVHLLQRLDEMGAVLLDAQVLNEHTASLGAVLVHRHDFLRLLAQAVRVRASHEGTKWPSDPAPGGR